MKQYCPECKTAFPGRAPYCEACGYQFDDGSVPRPPRWIYLLVSAAAGICVAIGEYLFLH